MLLFPGENDTSGGSRVPSSPTLDHFLAILGALTRAITRKITSRVSQNASKKSCNASKKKGLRPTKSEVKAQRNANFQKAKSDEKGQKNPKKGRFWDALGTSRGGLGDASRDVFDVSGASRRENPKKRRCSRRLLFLEEKLYL